MQLNRFLILLSNLTMAALFLYTYSSLGALRAEIHSASEVEPQLESPYEEAVQVEWRIPEPDEPHTLLQAIIRVESAGNTLAYNNAEKACGILQIRPIMIADVNRIFGEVRYTADDCWDPHKSVEMFYAYSHHYYPNGSSEQLARAWNGGPRGPRSRATLKYWEKVQTFMGREP